MRPEKQSGVALIITLIMLSVITVMAVAFLALSRRERSSVVHTANSLDAELMSGAALERAKAEILANILTSFTNPHPAGTLTNIPPGPDFFVSRMATLYPPFTNQADLAAISNQWVEPIAPVFVNTNRGGSAGLSDFRYYLDLNRNGQFEPTGENQILDDSGSPIVVGTNSTAQFVGDPVWKGMLSNPRFAHSRFNRFIGRFAYAVVPVGRSLDLNFMHNAAGLVSSPFLPIESGYLRNQGAGSWEINLAGFLADLNTNQWNNPIGPYVYNRAMFPPTGGFAFIDAGGLLNYRYGENIANLAPANLLFANPPALTTDYIDSYLTALPFPTLGVKSSFDNDNVTKPWVGADSVRHFFTLHDSFRSPKAGISDYPLFTTHLATASTNAGSYNRYSFYRLAAQLGTESTPEPEGSKLNLNYKNIGGLSATNLVPWTNSVEFFTNAAWRMLREEFKTNTAANDIFANVHRFRIPVASKSITYSNGEPVRLYSPRVHRILQMAANIYEATTGTNQATGAVPFFPTVFRPRFEFVNGNLFITDYVEEARVGFAGSLLSAADGLPGFPIPLRLRDLNEVTNSPAPSISSDDMVYGVPLIIGARKGYPNFNEFAIQTIADFTRKIEVRKRVLGGSTTETNQMFIMGISNVFAMEAWNSYKTDYPQQVRMFCTNIATATLTNDAGLSMPIVFRGGTNTLPLTFAGNQFVPVIALNTVLTQSVYHTLPFAGFEPISSLNVFDRATSSYTNHWGLRIRNKFVYLLLDGTKIVDAVTASDYSADFDISKELNNPSGDSLKLWNNDPAGNVTTGIKQQIGISLGTIPVSDWNSYGAYQVNDKQKGIDGLKVFLGLAPPPPGAPSTNLVMQAPFTPTRKMVQTSKWEVNDPLVHYLSDDLRKFENGMLTNDVSVQTIKANQSPSITDGTSIGRMNDRYRPWGGNPNNGTSETDPAQFDLRIKDPGVATSDYWDFPTQKFPSIGWLGRVHRGTPWQTMYLKAYPLDADGVDKWMMPQGGPGLAFETHPTNDWKFLDLFTAALHPNATRGQLSVNQTNLAAWSAVLSGVAVTTIPDITPQTLQRTDWLIEPAGNPLPQYANYPPLLKIFEGISRERENMPFRRFEHIGDILRAPELTVNSPFLTPPIITAQVDLKTQQYLLKDIDYERIPDQIMSLLKVGEPRFVIYAFGQSLKPEFVDPKSGVALNYQITGEVATRAVVRVDFDRVTLPNGGPITDPTDPNYGKPDVTRPHIVVESFNLIPPE